MTYSFKPGCMAIFLPVLLIPYLIAGALGVYGIQDISNTQEPQAKKIFDKGLKTGTLSRGDLTALSVQSNDVVQLSKAATKRIADNKKRQAVVESNYYAKYEKDLEKFYNSLDYMLFAHTVDSLNRDAPPTIDAMAVYCGGMGGTFDSNGLQTINIRDPSCGQFIDKYTKGLIEAQKIRDQELKTDGYGSILLAFFIAGFYTGLLAILNAPNNKAYQAVTNAIR